MYVTHSITDTVLILHISLARKSNTLKRNQNNSFRRESRFLTEIFVLISLVWIPVVDNLIKYIYSLPYFQNWTRRGAWGRTWKNAEHFWRFQTPDSLTALLKILINKRQFKSSESYLSVGIIFCNSWMIRFIRLRLKVKGFVNTY